MNESRQGADYHSYPYPRLFPRYPTPAPSALNAPPFSSTPPPNKLTVAPEVPPVKPFLETTAARRVQTTYHPRSRFQAPYPRRRRARRRLFLHHSSRLVFICGPPAAAAPEPRPSIPPASSLPVTPQAAGSRRKNGRGEGRERVEDCITIYAKTYEAVAK